MLEINKVYQGDCLEVMKQIDDNSIDLIVTDPPYNFDNKGGGFYAKNKSTQRTYLNELLNLNCTAFNPSVFLDFLKKKCKKFYGYFFCNKSLLLNYINFAVINGYQYDVLVVAKSNPIPSFNNHHLPDLEYVVMIREKGTYFSKHNDFADYKKFNIISCKKGIHPSEKNIDILQKYIRVSSKEGDLIVDPFAGSGTTGVACRNLNRNYILIEKEEKYIEIINKRLSQPTQTRIGV